MKGQDIPQFFAKNFNTRNVIIVGKRRSVVETCTSYFTDFFVKNVIVGNVVQKNAVTSSKEPLLTFAENKSLSDLANRIA